MSELKPCPYCAGTFRGYADADGPHAGLVQMVCGCGARGPAAIGIEPANTAWNRRADALARELAGWIMRRYGS